jgi:hypothetical protein
MKLFFLAITFFLFLFANAQKLPAFKTLRYEEDYTFLKNDSNPGSFSKIKYRPISGKGNSYISLGGEIRYQYFNIRNEDWGDSPMDKDGFLFSRFLAHADLHAGNNFRFFVQLQGSMANGKASGTSPVDENPLDLHQAFFDLTTKQKNITLRVGRQELSYGSQRLISVRELPNNRQAFDAAKVILSLRNTKLDAFYSRYVSARKGIFDDVSNKDINLWGVYLVRNNIPFIKNLDLYYLGLHREEAAFNDGSGAELRHSIGSRIWSNSKTWKYDFEGVFQFGKFTGKQISAWTISSNTSYKFTQTKLKPEIGLKTEIISGDQQIGDDKLETFNPLFPRGAYFGLAALIGPSNLFDIHPSTALELVNDKLTWTVDFDLLWRQSINDGIYAPNVSLIYPSGNSINRHIGNQLATDLTFTPNRFLMLRIEGTLFKAGPFLKDVSSGRDILFLGATTQLKF